MGDIVSLRSARKRVQRQRDQKAAAENRVRFGRTKAERSLEAARTAKSISDLSGHRVETGDER